MTDQFQEEFLAQILALASLGETEANIAEFLKGEYERDVIFGTAAKRPAIHKAYVLVAVEFQKGIESCRQTFSEADTSWTANMDSWQASIICSVMEHTGEWQI